MRRLLSIAVVALAAVSVIFARGGMQAPEAEQPAEKKLIDLKSDNMGPVAPGDSVIFWWQLRRAAQRRRHYV